MRRAVIFILLLAGCSTARRTPDQIPAAIMPRWMPDAPRPAETVRAIPATVYSLSWTHDSAPELLTYRVDYGLSVDSMTNSLMTQASNCKIAPGRDGPWIFTIRGCDGRKYSELDNLNLVIK